jgi:hypothetical protein
LLQPGARIKPMKEQVGQNISRYIAATVGGLIFGAVVAEVINASELLAFRLNAPYAGVVFGAAILLSMMIYDYFDSKAKQSKEAQGKFEKLLSVYGVVAGFILLLIVISLPFLWWGAIMTVAGAAKTGRVPF